MTHSAHPHHHAAGAATVKDPVCGMGVDPATSRNTRRTRRRRPSISAAPAAGRNSTPTRRATGADDGGAAAEAAPAGAIYTCPMHPEIRQDGPGACPICGMALEPLRVDGARRRRTPNWPT